MKRSNVLAWIMLLGITVCHASTTIQLGRYLTFTPAPVRHGLNQWVNYPINNSSTVSQTINSVLQSTDYHLLAENKSNYHIRYLYREKLPHYLLRKRKITIKTFLIKAAGHHYQLVVDKTHHLVGYVVRPGVYVARKKNLLERIAAFTRGNK